MSPASKSLVIDSSCILSLAFPEPNSQAVREVLRQLEREGVRMAAPSLWAYEVASVLRTGERRGRIDPALTASFLKGIAGLPIEIIHFPPERIFGHVLPLSREHNLTGYDAAYLQLALNEGADLATLDAELRTAATGAGVRVWPRSFLSG